MVGQRGFRTKRTLMLKHGVYTVVYTLMLKHGVVTDAGTDLMMFALKLLKSGK
jgi:hypothetical protein